MAKRRRFNEYSHMDIDGAVVYFPSQAPLVTQEVRKPAYEQWMRHQCIFNHEFNDRRVPKHLMVALFNVTPAIHGDVIALENGSFDVTQAFNAFVQRIRERFGTPADGAVVAATECILKCFDQHPDAVAAYPSKYARLGKIDHAKRAARMQTFRAEYDTVDT